LRRRFLGRPVSGITGRLLVVVLVVVLPMLVLLTVTTVAQIDQARRESVETARHSDAQAGLGITALFSSVTNLLLTVSSFPSVQVSDAGRCSYILHQMAAKLDAYSAIAVADRNGTILCSSAANNAGDSFADATWYA